MYANKNKEKSKSRTVATGADSTRLSSKDSRYEAGDYEAVPESIRKIRDARNRELEEQNALPAEEIIARQEAEIAELKRQAEAAAMTNKYKSVLDNEEEHPTFKNPDSMADFGDYEAVASTARFEAAGRDPNQKVFRAKPSVATRKVAAPSDLSPGDYEAVAASARHAVSPDEYLAAQAEQNEEEESAEPPAPSADEEIHSEPYTPPIAAEPAAQAAPSAQSDDVIHSEPYTPPKPAPAPVSAADYTVQSYAAPEQEPAPAPVPEPVSASDYTVDSYTAPAPSPASSNDNVIHREPYTPPAAASYTSSATTSSGYSSSTYVPPAQRAKYSNDGNYDVGGGPMYSPTSGKRIASFEDMAPGDYEAVADSSYDDSDMDLADGSYDFDKYLAGAPSLQMHQEPAISPEEAAWADLGTDVTEDIDDVDITDEQTRALTEAIAQETLSNQPGTQFEDIIDNVIAKVLERKKAEDAAKAAAQQQNQPEQPQPPEQQPAPQQPPQPEQQIPAEPEQPEQAEQQPVQNPAVPEPVHTPEEVQPKNTGLTPGAIDPSTPIEDIPALIVAELDSAGEVSDDDIRKSIDAALIGKLTTGELTLDSVQAVRNKILDEVHEMQAEEARILAQLEGKPEKHPFDPDFLPADIAVEDIPDAVIAELDNVEGEVSDDEVKQSIDKVMIAKLAKGELTLDSFQEARDSIFDTLGIETAEEQAEEPEPEEQPEPVEEPIPEPEEQPEPVEEPIPEPEEQPEPVEEPIPEPVEEVVEEEPTPVEEAEPEPIQESEEATEEEPAPPEQHAEEPEEEPIAGPDLELTQAEELVVESDEEQTEFTEEPVTEESIEIEPETEPETPEEPVSDSESEEQSSAEIEHAPENNEPSEEEEEEEKTIPIPVPKEPTVLEYDPYADVFVNPVYKDESAEPEEPETVEELSETEEPEEPESFDEPPEPENLEESEETEESELFEESEESEIAEEAEETDESEELLETPLSAAAVLAMQNQLDEEPDETAEETAESGEPETEPEPSVEEKPELESEDESEPSVEEEPELELELEPEPEITEDTEEIAEPETEEVIPTEESEEFEPETEEETVSEELEPETEDEAVSEEPEPEVEERSEQDSIFDRQITFDDILRNPFVNDFEPLEPAEEPSEEPEAEAEEPSEELVEEPEEAPDEEPAEESAEEPVEEIEAEAKEPAQETEIEEPEQEGFDGQEPAEETSPKEEPASEPEDESEPEVSEEPDEYAEAKAKRHEDMQNALLMAMIDDKEKTFSDAVNYMIDQDELNARTLRTRMPIDRDTLDHVIKERDFIPDKKTAIAICFALRLTWEDSVRLLYKAGYSLNDTQRYDLTIEYLMRRGVYDQNMINSVLMGSGLEGFGIPQSEIR